MSQSQNALPFKTFDQEYDLAQALLARTGRDLFAGITNPDDRKAAARIAIIMNRLQGEFGARYESIYGEPLPQVRRLDPPPKTRKSA